MPQAVFSASCYSSTHLPSLKIIKNRIERAQFSKSVHIQFGAKLFFHQSKQRYARQGIPFSGIRSIRVCKSAVGKPREYRRKASHQATSHIVHLCSPCSFVTHSPRTTHRAPLFVRRQVFKATALHHHQRGTHTKHSRSRASDAAPDHAPCKSTDTPDNFANKASTAGTFGGLP